MSKCIFLLSACLFLLISPIQAQQDSTYYKQLHYLCKAWGLAKYFHPDIAKGNINWDDELLSTLGRVSPGTSSNAYNNIVLNMLETAGLPSRRGGNLPNVVDSLNNNNDLWIKDASLSDTVKLYLDSIVDSFWPQSNVYFRKGTSSAPTFDFDSSYYLTPDFPAKEYRLLALFRFWNIIDRFFPYKNLMDQNWDSTFMEIVPLIVNAKSDVEYALAFKRMLSRIDDTHGFLISSAYQRWLGSLYWPLAAQYVDSSIVVKNVHPSAAVLLKPGDVISEINALPIQQLYDSLRPIVNASNEAAAWREIIRIMSRTTSFTIDLTLQGKDSNKTIKLSTLFYQNYQSMFVPNPKWRDTVLSNDCNVRIIDLGVLQKNDVALAFDGLSREDHIVFDVRSYPRGDTYYSVMDRLFVGRLSSGHFTKPSYSYPGTFIWDNQDFSFTNFSQKFKGKISILFDENTQSHAEFYCMALEQYQNAKKIGSTTAGADGNVARIYLPGKLTAMASFLGWYYPDKTQTQRIGIIPDIYVRPTIEGIRNGEDEVLNRAFQEINCVKGLSIPENNFESEIEIFPVPAANFINLKLNGIALKDAVNLRIYDMQGNMVHTVIISTKQTTIEITDFTPGAYLLLVSGQENVLSKRFIKN